MRIRAKTFRDWWNSIASSRVSKYSTRSKDNSTSSQAAQRPSGSWVMKQSMSPSRTIDSEAAMRSSKVSKPSASANSSSSMCSNTFDHLHEFQERSSSLVSCEHGPLPVLGPFVPILGCAFGGDQVGPRFEGPLAAMAARDD